MKRWLPILIIIALLLPTHLSAAAPYGPVVLSDGSNGGNYAAVDSSGNVSVKIGSGTTTQNVCATNTTFAAAAALSDSMSNPTTCQVGSDLLVWNGSTWARVTSPPGVNTTTTTAAGIPFSAPALYRATNAGNGDYRPWIVAGQIGDAATGDNTATVGPALSNGSTFDVQRNNMPVTAIASGTYSSTQTQADQTNFNGRGVKCFYNASADVGVGSFTVEIDGKDPVSGSYYAILTAAALATTGTKVLTVYPGITAVTNLAVSDVLPRTWRVLATYNSGTSQTFSIGCTVMV